MTTELFTLNNETLTYENIEVLNSINLSIQKGEKVALLGKSGSGKSTLLKRLHELNSSNVSYIPQELGLVNTLSSFHNVYISRLDKKSTFYNLLNLVKPFKTEVSSIKEILKQLHLEDKLFEKSQNLSGGQKQRVAIARSIYSNKNILLADEPISALDEFVTQKVLKTIHNSFETIVCALHNVEIALTHFDRIIGIKDGKIILDKECKDISQEDTKKLYHATV